MKKLYKAILIIIIIICFFFLFNDRLLIKSNPFKEIYKVMIIPVNKINIGFNEMKNYKSISKKNNELEKDNILLNSLKEENNTLLEENKELKSLMDLKEDNKKQVYARIVSRNRLYFFDTFVISRGSKSNISINDAVITSSGLIGRVVSTSTNYSTVRMITSNYDDNKLSVIIKNDSSLNGNIKEYKDGYLLVEGISNHNKINIGDKVYTSGLGKLPKGLLIGVVTQVKEDSYGISRILYVKPSSSLEGINYVMVLTND